MTLVRIPSVSWGCVTEATVLQAQMYCTISTVSSRILKICWPRWPINFLLSSSDLKQRLFFWPLRVTELTVEMVQYPVAEVLNSELPHLVSEIQTQPLWLKPISSTEWLKLRHF